MVLGLDKICFFSCLFCFAFVLKICTHFAFQFTFYHTHFASYFSLKFQHYYVTSIKIIKNEVRCRDDTVPKTVDTRRHCEEE